MVVTATRLPGITFEARNPAVATDLPRMDIAAFVGFAARGPVNLPVAVEDPGSFHDLFGEDVTLARDDESGALVYGELPAAVRAFFKNGGRRCWVVRVAAADAVVNRFVVPGLLAVRADTAEIGAALALARSPGVWSDRLTVNATLLERRVSLSATRLGQLTIGGLRPGDLLQLDYGTHGVVAFQRIMTGRGPAALAKDPIPISPDWWFRRAARVDLDATSPGSHDSTTWLAPPLRTTWLRGGDAPDSLPSSPPVSDRQLALTRWGVRDDSFIFGIERDAVLDLQPGSWLKVELAPEAAPPGAEPLLLMQVDHIQAAEPSSSQRAGGEPLWIVANRGWWVLDAAKTAADLGGVMPRARVVTFELRVRDADDGVRRLSDLGFTSPHPMYWGDVPDDLSLFREDPAAPTRSGLPSSALADAVRRPRFPLAPEAMDSATALETMFLPLGLEGVPDDRFDQPPLRDARDESARDGLTTFDPALFIDAELANLSSETLVAEAFQVQYVNQYPGSGQRSGRLLTGLHALLPIDEVSMAAVPDAVQRRWRSDPSSVGALGAPTLFEIAHRPGSTQLAWAPPSASGNQSADLLTYVLQASFDPRFASTARTWSVDGVAFEHSADAFPGCAASLFYRVQAVSTTVGAGPWSNTRSDRVPPGAFEPCAPEHPPAPASLTVSDTGGRLRVEWDPVPGDLVAYRLEQASDPELTGASVAYAGRLTTFEVLRGAEPIVYLRVAVDVGGRQGPWSPTASIGVIASQAFVTETAAEYDEREDENGLLQIHAALVRMCAARGDVHAVMALPRHFRDDRAIAYVERLSQMLRQLDSERLLSYASVFHPWPVVRETAGRADLSTWPIAPDGPVSGTIAARTILKGAWYSTANQVLNGVVTLQPYLGDASLALLDGRVNVIWQQPQGFVALDALTLHPGIELGHLHVRRLLILLRRLAAREGNLAVFDNNDDRLRRLVNRELERVLSDLFVRGAFAGTTHDEGYRIVTDDSINPRQGVDAGRFIIELQVAPSQPLMFLTVRLVQEGGTIVGVEEH